MSVLVWTSCERKTCLSAYFTARSGHVNNLPNILVRGTTTRSYRLRLFQWSRTNRGNLTGWVYISCNCIINMRMNQILSLAWPGFVRLSLFWYVAARSLVLFYRRFGTKNRFLKKGQIRCSETTVTNYQGTLRNIPEDIRSNVLLIFMLCLWPSFCSQDMNIFLVFFGIYF